MTEFEAAHAFVTDHARAPAGAVKAGGVLEGRVAFVRHCREAGLGPTPERRQLVLDLRQTAAEYFAGVGRYLDGSEAAERLLDPDDLADVPPLFLLEGLECRGWRRAFLDRSVSSGRDG